MKHTNQEVYKAAMLSNARARAIKLNLEFNITVDDIEIPERCPVLGIKLEKGIGKGGKYNSPSLDRINSYLGYIKGNVKVISWRANKIKSSATTEELERITCYVREG